MNKKALAITIIYAVVMISIIVSLIIGGIFLIKKYVHISKESITGEKFVEIMEDNDFKVSDVKYQFKNSDVKIKEAYVAKKDEYQIEFYTFEDVDDADYFFRINKEKFDSNSAKTRVDLNGKNYASFNIEANGKYKFLERIDETVIYINVDREYKDNVKDMVKILGY